MGKQTKETNQQLSLFNLEELLGKDLSYADIEDAIKKLEQINQKLQQAKIKAKAREVEERVLKEEQARKQKLEEERKKKDALIREITSMELPMDWENVFNSDARTQGVHIDSIPDALVKSLVTLGRVDIEYISSITGADYKTVICALKGSIYQNPEKWDECFYKGWETSEEYLSGNLMRKWIAARKANKEYKGYFQDNITAISKVLPQPIPTKDIYITLGSPWVPNDIIDDFINHILNTGGKNRYCYTLHDPITGTWELSSKAYYNQYVRATSTYGTPCMPAMNIIEKTLNMKAVVVNEKIPSAFNASGEKRIINESETVAALAKQDKLIKEFQHWVWLDEKRKTRLEEIYDSNFACVRRRVFDGSFLEFPTMSPSIKLYPYQKDAVARIIFTPNTLLAHDVGAGKTYVMIAAGMELVRMGLSKKNMYVVPNNIVGQWKSIFLTMYPNAKILCVEPNTFRGEKREAVLKKIRDEDFDGIIIAYSCFEQIPLSREYYRQKLSEQREVINSLASDTNKATSRLRKKREAISEKLAELSIALEDLYDTVYFDELGITRLFVDEAHNFKNVPLETKANTVLGINATGSKKCQDMMDKVSLIQKQNDGKGVVLATGTPITNSITDAFIMQKYLQSGELAMLDLQNFDSWIGMFAEKVTDFEIDVDTSSYRLATRFSKFHNLPELTALLSTIADFHHVDKSAGIPDADVKDALVAKTADFERYLQDISDRADNVRRGAVDRKEDNMLKITTDGRKAALDFRLVEPKASFTYQSKVARCVDNVVDIYYKTAKSKSAQLIFCDTSTPKSGFNVYDEIKSLLLAQGIPESEIEYIHNAETDAQRNKLFAKVRSGLVRVLLGSTFKLGLGVNVQDRLIALHHLDVPWRPADMIQREGRILRQGNLNPKVYIYRYITEGSFDAYSWQLLETKARFIGDLLSGSVVERSGSDVDDVALNYAEVKALAIGNPLIKERVETANELTRYMTLQRKSVEMRMHLEKELNEIPGKKQHQSELIAKCKSDIEYYEDWKRSYIPPMDSNSKKKEAEARAALRDKIHTEIIGNILQTRERELLDYRGFTIALPANMRIEKPYVWLIREGKYYVELGDTDRGYLVRIDNFLDTLDKNLEKFNETLQKLETTEIEIRQELSKKESYADKVDEYKNKLENIDKKLGVNKK